MKNSAESGIGTILILTDFSDAAVNATNYAAALAIQLHATRLIICYSEHIPSTMEIHLQNVILADVIHQRHQNQLDAVKKELRSWIQEPIAIDVYIDQRPLDIIVNDFNNDKSVGLIVMGLAGKSALEQKLIGSNTILVTKTTTIPILIIPERATYKFIKKVVFACNLRKVSKVTPVFAIKHMVQKLGASLSILNVNQYEEHFHPNTIPERDYIRQLWGAEQPEYNFIENDDIVMGIMDFADENQVQLVIAVPRKYGFFAKLFHESLTKKLTYYIHLPLLLFKEENAI